MQFVAGWSFQEEAVVRIHSGVPLRNKLRQNEVEREDSPLSHVTLRSDHVNVEYIARIRIHCLHACRSNVIAAGVHPGDSGLSRRPGGLGVDPGRGYPEDGVGLPIIPTVPNLRIAAPRL